MSSRKVVLFIVLCAAVAALFAACNARPLPLPEQTVISTRRPSATAEAEETSTPFITRSPDSVLFMTYGDAAERQAYEQLVEAFKSQNPSIEFEMLFIPNQFAYRQRISEDFAAGQPPDVMLLNNRRYGFYALRRLLAPLGPKLQASNMVREADLFPEMVDAFRLDGELICVPQSGSNLVVYYNKTLFDRANVPYPRADWKWDDFLRTAQAMTRDTNGDGKTDVFGVGTEADLLRLAPFVWQNGGEIVDNYDEPTKMVLDSPEALEALRWVVDLQVKYHVVPSPQDEVIEAFETRFVNGSIAMFINQRRGVGLYRDEMQFDWDVAPLPQNKRAAGILQSEGYCIPQASLNREDAWKFVEFATSAQGQTILAASGRILPSMRSIAESDAFLQPGLKPANARVFLDTLPLVRNFPVLTNWPQIEEIVGEQIERAFHGTLALEVILPRAVERVNVIIKPR